MPKPQSVHRINREPNINLHRFKTPMGGDELTFAEVTALFQYKLISKQEVRAVLWEQKPELYFEEVLALVQYKIIKKREARKILWR